jgi:hypothetical protein
MEPIDKQLPSSGNERKTIRFSLSAWTVFGFGEGFFLLFVSDPVGTTQWLPTDLA